MLAAQFTLGPKGDKELAIYFVVALRHTLAAAFSNEICPALANESEADFDGTGGLSLIIFPPLKVSLSVRLVC